jgi:hypothetical protein
VRSWLVLAALVPGFALLAGAARAQPSVPSSFYGSVTIDGQPAPDGTEVRALIDGVDCTQSAPGERPAIRQGGATAYVVHVVHESQRPGCGREGKTVSFTVAGQPALQRGVWKAGPQQLDLSTGSAQIVPLPTFTPTSPGGAASPATGGASTPAPLVRPTGTPPTDDVQLPRTSSPPAAISPGLPGDGPAEAGPSDGRAAWVAIVAAAGALVAAGAVGGVVIARRRRPVRPGDSS